MKAIDACNVRFDAAKVILFVLMFALVITLLSAGEPGGHLSERPHPEEGHHAAGHALQVKIKQFSFFHIYKLLYFSRSPQEYQPAPNAAAEDGGGCQVLGGHQAPDLQRLLRGVHRHGRPHGPGNRWENYIF